MENPGATIYFDFTDPLSFLIDRELESLGASGTAVQRAPFELRPPPSPLVTLDDPPLAERWALARRLAGQAGVELDPPHLVPWTREAHELLAHAAEKGVAAPVRRAVFESYHLRRGDVGRVDVLVELARRCGLDPTETKAVLDVDRYAAHVVEARDSASARGVATVPLLVLGAARLEGFHNRMAIGTFLRDARDRHP